MSAKVKAIIEVPYLPGTPARVNHLTGVIEVNKSHFDKLPKVYKEFVIQHECGHLELNTRDEFAADEYAMNALLKKDYPLTQILQSLTRVLSHENPQHYGRTVALFNKLRHYDYSTNNNKKVLTKFNPTMNIPDQVVDVYSESYNPYSNFAWASLIPLAGDLLGGSSNNNAAAQQTAQQNAAMQAQLQAQQQQMQQMQLQQQMEAATRKADEPKEGNNDMLIIVLVIIVILIVTGVVIFRTKKGGKK